MTASGDTPAGDFAPSEIRRWFESRAAAELKVADTSAPGSDRTAWQGALLAEIAIVKGLPGPAEAAGGAALSGADGEAADKALEALGWDPAAAFKTLSRPEPTLPAEKLIARLRLQIEAVDPALVVALDAEAAQDVAAVYGIPQPGWGAPVRVAGRRFVAVEGLEESLSKPALKKRVWRQLQAAKPEGPVY